MYAAAIELAKSHALIAYLLVFIFALSEALPLVGALVPGTVIIVSLSALAPTGALHPGWLILSAFGGAVAGDGLAYWLGYRYHRQIITRRRNQNYAGSRYWEPS